MKATDASSSGKLPFFRKKLLIEPATLMAPFKSDTIRDETVVEGLYDALNVFIVRNEKEASIEFVLTETVEYNKLIVNLGVFPLAVHHSQFFHPRQNCGRPRNLHVIMVDYNN
jgi:hypothetical protein